jgi:Fe-S cluster assembly iron-binding protein IscA
MLAMTEAAAEAITALTAQEGEKETGGLRFSVEEQADQGAQLAVSVAAAPEDGDQVLGSAAGAKVFLQPQAAEVLDDKVLDVQQDDDGQLNFAVLQQPDRPQG